MTKTTGSDTLAGAAGRLRLWEELAGGRRVFRGDTALVAAVIVVLGLAIGLATTVFAVFDAVLLRPLPFADAGRLYRVWEANPTISDQLEGPSAANLLDWQAGSGAVESTAAWWVDRAVVRVGDRAVNHEVAHVTGSFFGLLGVPTLQGRHLGPRDAGGSWYTPGGVHTGPERVVVVSHRFWREVLGGADIGSPATRIDLNGESWEVIGVMPAAFAFPNSAVDLWNPWDLEAEPGGPRRDERFLGAVARLSDGTLPEAAEADLNRIARAIAQDHPTTNAGWEVRITPLRDHLVGSSRQPLRVVMAAVGLLLIAAFANTGGLLMSRSASRRAEFAVRRALGGDVGRLRMQVLIETGWLSAAATGLGVIVALGSLKLVTASDLWAIPLLETARLDLRVLAAAAATGALGAVLGGLVPARSVARGDLSGVFKSAGALGADRGQAMLRRVAVASQIAVSVILLVGSALVVTSMARLLAADTGWDTEGVVVARVGITSETAESAGGRVPFFEQLLAGIAELPRVTAVGGSTALPLSGVGADFERPYWAEGAAPEPGTAPEAWMRMATPGYFEAIGRPLLAGRDFVAGDRLAPPGTAASGEMVLVAVVSASLASSLWDSPSTAVGSRLVVDTTRDNIAYEVVGVVQDALHSDLRTAPQAEIFLPHYQNPYPFLNIAIRTEVPIATMRDSVTRILNDIHPAQPLHSITSMRELVGQSLGRERLVLSLLGLFSVATLGLSVVAVFSLMSHWVRTKTAELSLRRVLGASDAQLFRLVLREGWGLAAVGVVIGAGVAIPLSSLLGAVVSDVGRFDPLGFVVPALVVLAASATACCVPALRALRVDPARALRSAR